MPSPLWMIVSLGLAACLPSAPAQPGVAAGSSRTQAMGCAVCHPYPLRDGVHRYHLDVAEGIKSLNGPITCLDCHSRSVQGREAVFLDTIFINAFDLEKSSYDLPDAASIRLLPILRIDTLRQNRPIPIAPPDSAGTMAEWMTARAHLDGRVQVAMDFRNGGAASYDIRAQTCSAVACHRNADGDVYPLVPVGGAKRSAAR